MMRLVVPFLVLSLLGAFGCGSRNAEDAEGAEPLRSDNDPPSSRRMPPGHPNVASGATDPHAGANLHDRPGAAANNPHAQAGGGSAGTDPHAGVGPHGGGAGAAAPSAPGEPLAGGVRWTVPDTFVNERPASSMRAAQYRVPRAQGDTQDAQITVFYFGAGQGGAVQDNIDRWVGQVAQPDGRPSSDVARTDRRTVNGMPVTVVTVEGRLGGSSMPGMPAAPAIDRGQLLGAIVEGPNGPVFFKMTGPTATVTAARPAFEELIGSFRTGG